MIKAAITAAAALLTLGSGNAAWADFRWSEALSNDLTERVQAGDYGTVTSVLILAEGEPLYEAYFQGFDADSLHDTRSVGKTITGMAVGAAVLEGALSLDEPLAPFFTDVAPFQNDDPRKQAITARDLLTMSSVLECNDFTPYSRGNEERMYLVEDWVSFFWDLPIKGFPSWETPPEATEFGRAFSYCTAGVQMLGEAVARATGEPFTDFAETRLFAPLSISEFQWSINGAGQAHLGGGLRLTTQGLGRLGDMQRLSGVYEGRRLLPESFAQAAITPQLRANDNNLYGFLWWLPEVEGADGPVQVAAMSGNGGNRVWILPEHGLTVVLTKTDYNTRAAHDLSDLFLQEVIIANLD